MPFKKGEIPQGATPFKKGQSGNPKGRPKLPDINDALAKILAEEEDGQSALEAIMVTLRIKAMKGDVRAAQELLDRAYGKAKQQVEMSGEMNIFPGAVIEIVHNGETQDKDNT